MRAEAIEKIVEIAQPERMEIDDRPYTTKQIFPVLEPTPESLSLCTLTGLVDYLTANIDSLDTENLIIHVVNEYTASLKNSFTIPFYQRSRYILCTSPALAFSFNNWMPIENFIIALQTQFIQTHITDELLKIVGNLCESAVHTHTDDGKTQTVTTKSGIAQVEEKDLPNPVILKPYRTFREIEQPESLFVFRMKSAMAEGGAPACALFEADGEAWKLDAILNIRDWIGERLPHIAIIA